MEKRKRKTTEKRVRYFGFVNAVIASVSETRVETTREDDALVHATDDDKCDTRRRIAS